MSIVLTGVGYLGAALLRRLLERGDRVVGLDNFSSTPPDALGELPGRGCALLGGDVAEPRDVGRAFDCAAALGRGEPLVVYHLAAQASAAIAAREPEATERTNLVGARVLLEAARDRGARLVVFGGSFRVYGDDLVGAVVDEDTPYGRVADLSHLSKVYVELLARMIGVPFVSARLGVVYGRSPVMKTSPPSMTVPNLFCQRAARGEPLRVVDDRPMAFIHVADAVGALLAAAELGLAAGGSWRAVNAASEVASVGEVARIVQRLAQARGLQARVQGAAPAPGSFAVRSRLAAAGFRAERRLADGLGEVLDYFVERAG